uniref:WGS project CAEQ00000000 data, annotated contig 311 n=1 Tax=Trypanosoma congolense (strain IL3000) TaxID=1068625 RepID=F9WET0_TRYCI|nr:unnamed protein product [Trypanosoma congolense IL3000]
MSDGAAVAVLRPFPSSERPMISLSFTLRCEAVAAGINCADSSCSTSQLLRFLAPGCGAEGLSGDVERILLSAIGRALEAYTGLESARLTAASHLLGLSLENTRCLVDFLVYRPPIVSKPLAALLKFVTVVVKHAPPEVLRDEGNNILSALLQLLRCLPRSDKTPEPLSMLRAVRVTVRNVMRRVGHHLVGKGEDTTHKCKNGGQLLVDNDLIPWIERHLLPLNVVTGVAAREELREDRRLALALLAYVPAEGISPIAPPGPGRRLGLLYLAEAVIALLRGVAGPDELEDSEEEQARDFLRRVDAVVSSPVISRPDFSGAGLSGDDDLCGHMIPTDVVSDFLLAKDAAYQQDFELLERFISREYCTQASLEQRLCELGHTCGGLMYQPDDAAQQ